MGLKFRLGQNNLNLYGTEVELRKDCICGCTESPRKDENFYQFRVTDVKDIDLNRIVREQYESGNLVTLLTDGKDAKGLLVHNEFLEKYQKEDKLTLAGYNLCLNAGVSKMGISYENKTFTLSSNGNGICLDDARYLFLQKGELEKVSAELAAARAFVRKITVKVHTL